MYTTLSEAQTPMTLLLKGPPGGGKTYKAAHWPKLSLFNFDNNLRGLQKLPNSIKSSIKLVNPFNDKKDKPVEPLRIWDNFVDKLETVLVDGDIRTIAIDSMSTLVGRLMDKILGSDDPATKVQIQHYGDLSRYLKWFGDEVLSNSALDKNVILIAHEVMIFDETTKSTSYELNIPGRASTNYDMYFTDCWRCYAKQPISGPIQYRVRVLPTDKFNAKNSLSDLTEADFEWEKEKDKILKQIK
jgi:hypothetical protein